MASAELTQSIWDGPNRYDLTADDQTTLMLHGLLRLVVPGHYALSSADALRGDPGAVGVNHPEPAAVLAVIRSALAAQPVPRKMGLAVRNLVWVGPDAAGEYHAKNALIPYKLRPEYGNGFWLTEVDAYFPNEQAAFEAANIHYGAKIRSAVEVVEQQPAGQFFRTIWPDGRVSFRQVPAEHPDGEDIGPLYAEPIAIRMQQIRPADTETIDYSALLARHPLPWTWLDIGELVDARDEPIDLADDETMEFIAQTVNATQS